MWKKIALGATVAVVAVGGYAGYTSWASGAEIDQMERAIKTDLNKQAKEAGREVSAKSIDCVKTRCIAEGTDGERYVIRVTHGDNGEYMWEVDSAL
jgi:hypothetical protein